MNKLDTLDRGIGELRDLLSKGWRDIASGDLTAFERGEIRNQMVKAAADLRRCLQARESEIRRLRELSRNANNGPQSVRLRFLDTEYDVTIAPASPTAAPTAPTPSPHAASRDGAEQASP